MIGLPSQAVAEPEYPPSALRYVPVQDTALESVCQVYHIFQLCRHISLRRGLLLEKAVEHVPGLVTGILYPSDSGKDEL